MTVITISRQFGSGGDEIARAVCESLHFTPFNKRMIAQAAADSGFTEPLAGDSGSPAFTSFLDRLFDISPALGGGTGWLDDSPGLYTPERVVQGDHVSAALVERAVQAACQVGRMVILGRAGQVILQTCPGVLHVRIEAPLDERVRRVKGYLKKSRTLFNSEAELQRDAYDWVIERDAASADYVRRQYQVDWANPLLYHVVLNTGKLTLDQSVQVIIRLVRALYPEV